MPVSIRDDYPEGAAKGGSCYVCSAGRRDLRHPVSGVPRVERVVDLHQMIDFEGHLCMCESCGVEIGRLLGLVDPEREEEMAHAVAVLTAERDEALAERDEAHQLVDLIRGYDAHQPVLSATGDSPAVALAAATEPAELPSTAPAGRKSRAKASA